MVNQEVKLKSGMKVYPRGGGEAATVWAVTDTLIAFTKGSKVAWFPVALIQGKFEAGDIYVRG